MHPAHDQHVAAAGAGLVVGDEDGGGRLVGHRVGGAVNEAEQVAAVPMDEAILVGGDRRDAVELLDRCAGVLEDDVTGAAADPHPEIVLGGGRVVAAGPADRLEGRKVGRRVLRGDRAPQLRAESDHQVHAARRDGRRAEAAQGRSGGGQVDVGPKVELNELVGDRALREDPDLRNVHDCVAAYSTCRVRYLSANQWLNLLAGAHDSQPGPAHLAVLYPQQHETVTEWLLVAPAGNHQPMAAVRLSPALRFWWVVHRWLYRLSGGRIGTKVNGFEILLLTTRGRTSGEPRRVALQTLEHGDGWAVIASFAGEDRHPNWWLNLQAEPMATVQIGRRSTRVRAREATGDERAEFGIGSWLWTMPTRNTRSAPAGSSR